MATSGSGAVAALAVVDRALADIAAREGFKKPRFDVQSGSGANDGYTSLIYRAKIRDEDAAGRQDELKLICKTSMPLFGSLLPKMYAAEGRMLTEVLPTMEEIAGFTKPLPWPRCFHVVSDGPPPLCIVLDDLQPDGFSMARKREALDVQHCRLAVAALARFHGAGLALQHLRPAQFKATHESFINAFATDEMRSIFQAFTNHILGTGLLDKMKKRFPEGSEISATVERLFVAFAEDVVSMMCPEVEEGYTIIHGDCHSNNMMFQYDPNSGDVTACCLIDFQTVRYGCPALDLTTLLICCTEKAMRDEHLDSLLQYYHKNVQDTLRAARCADPDAVYSWERFQIQWKNALPYGICMAPMMYNGLNADEKKATEMHESLANIDKKDVTERADFKFSVVESTSDLLVDLAQDMVLWGVMPSASDIARRLEVAKNLK